LNHIIALENIEMTFKKRSIFSDLHLTIDRPKVVGFIGENGSGKSVLFKIIAGIYRADKGRVFIRDVKLGDGGIDFATNLGLLVDSPGFIGVYTGLANLKYLAGIQNKIDDDKIIELMQLVGLDPNDKTLVKNYSLGMKQKLGIIQAVMENQDIIILDEPFNALDAKSVSIVKELVMTLFEEGKTILLTSHNQMDLDDLCHEMYRIEDFKLNPVSTK